MIEVAGLTKRYGDTVAVDEVSFTVHPGRVTGFLGPNGAGKSTTIRMILGLDRPSAGRVLVAGQHYRTIRHPLRTVGALLDAASVHPHRTARAHLRWIAATNDLPNQRVPDVLEQVGLSDVGDKPAGAFSLGMLQRLGIAAAMLGDPQILIFDEPANGLDPEGIIWIRTLLRGLAGEGRTILVSSHLLAEMALTAHDLIVIGRGKLIANCPSTELIERMTDLTVRVRSPHLDELLARLHAEELTAHRDAAGLVVSGAGSDRIGDIAAANGITLHELSPSHGSLEQAFRRLTGEAVQFRSDASTADPHAAPSLHHQEVA